MKNASTLLALGLLGVVAYVFRDQLKATISGNKIGMSLKGAPVFGAPTAPGVPINLTSASGARIGEFVPGLGYIPQSELDKNPNSPSGGLGITGYD